MTDSYGLDIRNIDNLESVERNKRLHYVYDGFHFLADLKETNANLVIFFHGALAWTKERPVFRGIEYNKYLNNCDILSLSDKMSDIFPIERSAFYLSHHSLDHFSGYKAIIQSIIDKKVYSRIIFTSSSAGSIAALVFASIFKKICLILNPRIIPIERWYSNHIYPLTIIHNNTDIGTDIYKFMDTYGYPEKCIYYQNKNDANTYNTSMLPFQTYTENLKEFEIRVFDGDQPNEGKLHHHVNLPPDETLYGIINRMLVTVEYLY